MRRLIVARARAPMARFKTGEVMIRQHRRPPSVVQQAKFSIRAHYGDTLPHTTALKVFKLQAGDSHELSTRSGTGPWHGHRI
jgi:hypothetical protein